MVPTDPHSVRIQQRQFKRGAVWATFSLALAGALAGASIRNWFSEDVSRIPRGLSFETERVDLGDLLWNDVTTVQLVLLNTDDVSHQIVDIDASCGCTVIGEGYAGTTLAPGERLPLELTIEARLIVGPRSSTISVTSDSGHTCDALIEMDVQPAYLLSPVALDFGSIQLDSDLVPSKVVRFESLSFRIVNTPAADVDWIQCALADRGSNQEILVSVDPSRLPQGSSTASVFVRTDDPGVPDAAIPIVARGEQGLRVEPAHVYLRSGEPVEVHVTSPDYTVADIDQLYASTSALSTRLIDSGTISIRATTAAPPRELLTVTVVDSKGRKGRVLVSCF